MFVPVRGRPDPILYGFVDIVVIAAPNDDAPTRTDAEVSLFEQRLKVRNGFDNCAQGLVVWARDVLIEVCTLAWVLTAWMHFVDYVYILISKPKTFRTYSASYKYFGERT